MREVNKRRCWRDLDPSEWSKSQQRKAQRANAGLKPRSGLKTQRGTPNPVTEERRIQRCWNRRLEREQRAEQEREAREQEARDKRARAAEERNKFLKRPKVEEEKEEEKFNAGKNKEMEFLNTISQ